MDARSMTPWHTERPSSGMSAENAPRRQSVTSGCGPRVSLGNTSKGAFSPKRGEATSGACRQPGVRYSGSQQRGAGSGKAEI
jgi:hypothetical protein